MRHSNRRPWLALACVAAVLSTVLAAAPTALAAPSRAQTLAPQASEPVLLRDGVIVDAARGVTYLMNGEGRLDALRTVDGALLWSSPEAARPLLVMGDLLVAQAEPTAPGELPIVTLDRGAGKLVARASVELPAGLWARLTDGPRTSFRVAASPLDGRVALSWEGKRAAKDSEFQGYLPAPTDGEGPDAGPATRAARIQVERLGGSALLDPLSGVVATRQKAAASALVAAVGLRTFDGLGDIEGRKFLSVDGRHVLVSRPLDTRQVVERYHWAIYTRGGALVGETASDISAAPFVVAGSLALVEARPFVLHRGEETLHAPLRVRAVDLATGVEAWAQPILETAFFGPFPP